jgi:hypothetical protein
LDEEMREDGAFMLTIENDGYGFKIDIGKSYVNSVLCVYADSTYTVEDSGGPAQKFDNFTQISNSENVYRRSTLPVASKYNVNICKEEQVTSGSQDRDIFRSSVNLDNKDVMGSFSYAEPILEKEKDEEQLALLDEILLSFESLYLGEYMGNAEVISNDFGDYLYFKDCYPAKSYCIYYMVSKDEVAESNLSKGKEYVLDGEVVEGKAAAAAGTTYTYLKNVKVFEN